MNSGILGNYLLLFALTSQIIAVIWRHINIKFISFTAGSVGNILAFLLLIKSFVISDFTIKNVFLNSSSMVPLGYKVAASWSSHEGSMLLWLCLLSIMNLIYFYSLNHLLPKEVKNIQISISSFIQLLFISFIYFTSNPFVSFSFIPTEGLGLNPMLQDSAIMIHPPTLYLGYVTYISLFINAILILFFPTFRGQLSSSSKKFSYLALIFTSLGIALGAWWAYRELGWGGYWFFDPVENISILPWLLGIAGHHFLIVNARNGKYLKMSIIFSVLPFLISIYGMFLVRSGIITSVHAFAFSPERGFYLLVIISILTILTSGVIIAKWRYLSLIKNGQINFTEQLILIGNVFWFIAFMIMFIAITYPIYFFLFKNIDAIIDPDYYVKIFLPVFIPILLLAGFSQSINKQYRKYIIVDGFFLILSVLVAFYINYIQSINILSFLIISGSIYLILKTVSYFILATNFFRSIENKHISFFLGHFGFGLLALMITINSIFSTEINFIGKIRQEIKNENFNIILKDIKFAKGKNYLRQIVEFEIKDSANHIIILKPENRLYQIENSLSQEADIFSFLTYDIYAVVSKIDGEVISATIYYRPMMSFIWFAALVISVAFLFGISSKKKKLI